MVRKETLALPVIRNSLGQRHSLYQPETSRVFRTIHCSPVAVPTSARQERCRRGLRRLRCAFCYVGRKPVVAKDADFAPDSQPLVHRLLSQTAQKPCHSRGGRTNRADPGTPARRCRNDR